MKMSKSIKLKMIEYRRKNSAGVKASHDNWEKMSPDQMKVGLDLIKKIMNLPEF